MAHPSSDTGDVCPLLIPHTRLSSPEHAPRTLLDVGGNTGRFAARCCRRDPDLRVTVADLPGQLRDLRREMAAQGLGERVQSVEVDLLDERAPLPAGHDAIWMSQLLCCFAEDEIVSILERARDAMGEDTRLFILDTCWDRQEHEMASYCLKAVSLYFTVFANGNSRMYRGRDIVECVTRAGLRVDQDRDQVALSHTLFRCRRA